MQKIFVTGANGTVGREVVAALKNLSDISVTAASRSSATPFDYADATTFSAADGHDAVFLLAPPLDPTAHQLVTPFLDYLIAHGNPRITYLSAYGMQTLPALPVHQLLEARLHQLQSARSARITILRPTFFASNFAQYERDNIEQRNMIFNPAGTGATAFVDPKDIGRVAALTLTEDKHAGQMYTLTGPRTYTMEQVATVLSSQLSRPIIYPAPSDEQYRTALAQAGAPAFVADYMIAVYGLIRQKKVNHVSTDVERLTGQQPTDLSVVIQRDFS
ncbi:NAD(P)H azoreductase [Neolewinella maritima]|uniref:NAD(P)H azoreductase n=1 Tax=Neolewinella maritima TaxID=1383882 RepID=A0ABN8F5N4_9BACT|nr:hypothetical protein [Neolewinella maritima]CAH1002221.1 NAD(P)H azoreductase [Neolewinella maritima]